MSENELVFFSDSHRPFPCPPKTRRNMAGEGDGKIFFLPKKKKPPDERITGETADEKATSDSTVRQLPTRRRCTNDQRVPTTHACDQEVRRPLATAEPPRLEVTVAASNITVETADARVSSDSTVRQSPRRRRTNDHRRVSTTCPLQLACISSA